jgi:hypothetical protein
VFNMVRRAALGVYQEQIFRSASGYTTNKTCICEISHENKNKVYIRSRSEMGHAEVTNRTHTLSLSFPDTIF